MDDVSLISEVLRLRFTNKKNIVELSFYAIKMKGYDAVLNGQAMSEGLEDGPKLEHIFNAARERYEREGVAPHIND